MAPLLLLLGLAGPALAQYSSCPEAYGLQLYPHEQYCDKFYKCANGNGRFREGLLYFVVVTNERVYIMSKCGDS
jgi:hypothetical protein